MLNQPLPTELSAAEMSPDAFRESGHMLVNMIADFFEQLPQLPVTSGEQPAELRKLLPGESLPADGRPAPELLEETTTLLKEHSLFNGHPRFWGYITGAPAPMGMLADFLASSINPNAGAFILSPMATEIERQTVKWLGSFIGYDDNAGGLFVSGGNMANFVGFLAGSRAKLKGDIRKNGIASIIGVDKKAFVYCAMGTHTWIQKATDLFGIGTDSIRWISTHENGQLDCTELERQIEADKNEGHKPFLVVGNAGSVATGIVDQLSLIAEICRRHDLWFHIDGAYGAPAASLPENENLFEGLTAADSVAIDPHKWLYSPLEAGCLLIRNENYLPDAFSFQPDYYNFRGKDEEAVINFHEHGMQNSRGFRALKVWLMLRHFGKNGYMDMIRRDIELAKYLYKLVEETEYLEAVSCRLGITAFRFIPPGEPLPESQLNKINENILNKLQAGGEVFISNAVVNGRYCLRACFVNFRTQTDDVDALVETVLRLGRESIT